MPTINELAQEVAKLRSRVEASETAAKGIADKTSRQVTPPLRHQA